VNKNYVGVQKRTFEHAVTHLLETEYKLLGSRRVLTLLAEDIKQMATQFRPEQEHVQSGWMVFTGTKATGPKAHPGRTAGEYVLVTLAWPILLPEDVDAVVRFASVAPGREQTSALLKKRLVRIIEHGLNHPDGPVLLTNADLSLMLGQSCSCISKTLNQIRQETGKALPTKGYFFDQGVRPTHKAEVVRLYEVGLDEAEIARQTNHHQSSVGRYLRDYARVKLLVKRHIILDAIPTLLGMQPSVVNAYVDLLQLYHPSLCESIEQPSTEI
jgi:hypothetical protein